MTDLNAAFRQERLDLIQSLRDGAADMLTRAREYNQGIDQRIADGKLVSIGSDRYRVEDPGSWDNGEVWTYRKMSEQAPALLLPETGLDMSLGTAALYTRVPAWHELGNVVPEGIADVSAVIKLGGIDFTVMQRPAMFFNGSEYVEVPGKFVNFRSDTVAPLGIVGKIYTPFQNADAFAFLQELADDHGVLWESAGATREGSQVFISMRIPETLTIDTEGINDPLDLFIVMVNSHDGSTLIKAVMTPWRPVCANTERFALRDAASSWGIRHTASAPARAAEARRTLGLSLKYAEALQAEEEQLARNKMLLDEFRELLDETFPVDEDAGKNAKTLAANRDRLIMERYSEETARAGRTAYAAERTLTGYWDNDTIRRVRGGTLAAARATAIIDGADDEKKNKVHKKLMLRVR